VAPEATHRGHGSGRHDLLALDLGQSTSVERVLVAPEARDHVGTGRDGGGAEAKVVSR
jgi:hypothetical protein